MTRWALLMTLVIVAASPADARGRKGKDPETVISKRGKLIFEDDFSGKELEWTFTPTECQWQVLKGAATTKSTGPSTKNRIFRPFPPMRDFVIQFRLMAPQGVSVWMVYCTTTKFPSVRLELGTPAGSMTSIVTWTPETGTSSLALSPFPYRKPRWVTVLFEAISSEYALTVDGRTITCREPLLAAERKADRVEIRIHRDQPDLVAIDDVKVWEALPKDEEEEGKGKEKKKRR